MLLDTDDVIYIDQVRLNFYKSAHNLLLLRNCELRAQGTHRLRRPGMCWEIAHLGEDQ